MPFDRRRFAASLTVVGSSILGLGIILVVVKLCMLIAWELAIPTVVAGLIALVAGWILR